MSTHLNIRNISSTEHFFADCFVRGVESHPYTDEFDLSDTSIQTDVLEDNDVMIQLSADGKNYAIHIVELID